MNRRHHRNAGWRGLVAALAVPTVVGAVLVTLPAPARAAQTIGYPTFTGPAVPQPPVGYTTGNMMQAIYNAESVRHRLLDGPAAGPVRATTRPRYAG